MNNTALGAENKKEQTINFISEAHEKFYYEKLKEVRYQDVYQCGQYLDSSTSSVSAGKRSGTAD